VIDESQPSSLELPPLCVRLNESTGKLPGQISIQLPRDISLSLIRRRLATPVGEFTVPDVEITSCEWADLELSAA